MMNSGGLVSEGKIPVPLKSISVDVQVQGHVVTVTSTLQYVNEEERHLEALFVFPLPADAAVCHFSAKIGEQEIVAEVQERQSARDQYDDAVSSGQQAFLLEESAESSDVFRLCVGCLSPGQNAAITIIYVTELAVQADHALRFCLPAVLNPRYTPAGSGGGIVSEISSVCGSVPYSLTLSVHVSSPNPISKLESNCTLDPLVFLNSEHTHATVNLSPGHMFDKDVELFLYYQNTHQPTAIVEAGVATDQPGSLMGDPVVMISLYPEFPEEVMSSLGSQGEFVFVVDRSGSMDDMMHHGKGAQSRIEGAKDTLLLLLKSLPMGCYFNIYGFGSHFESLFPKSVLYNQDTMDEALKRVKKMQADMVGTEILQPLKHIYNQPCYPDHPRQLFIFTDGEVFNTKEVLDLVKSHTHSHRCFSFGIGEGASTTLITGMAREGSGHAQFITGSDRMQPKVMQSLKLALQPAVVNISVKWTVQDGITVETLSQPINVIFHGQRTLIYAHLKGESSGSSEGTVTVTYSLKDQPVTNQLHFCLKPTEDTGLAVHRLAARALIQSLEQQERAGGAGMEDIKSRMVELSVQAGVSCVHTAFIAINKDSRQTVKGPLLQRRVPTADVSGVYCYQGPYQASLDNDLLLKSSLSGMFSSRRSGSFARCKSYVNAKFVGACAGIIGFKKSLKSNKGFPVQEQKSGIPQKVTALFSSRYETSAVLSGQEISQGKQEVDVELQKDSLLQLVSLQKASGCWDLTPTLAHVFGKTEDELTNQKPAEVNQSVWATLLALIWLYGCKIKDQVEWQFVAMKAASWIRSQKVCEIEVPERLIMSYDALRTFGTAQRCRQVPVRQATEQEILLAHSEEYLEAVKQTPKMTEEQLMEFSKKYNDVYFHQNIYHCAQLAVGATLQLVDSVMKREVRNGMALVRPPGHHSQRSAANGFCVFNNVAIAALYAQKNYSVNRILIVDWDVHHGQGVQYCFEEDPSVLYFSWHRYEHQTFWPNLPESDYTSIGKGKGSGFNINLPWNKVGMTNSDYLSAFFHVLLPVAYEFDPELVLVCAGFDSAIGDPEGEMCATPEIFAHLTQLLMPLAAGKMCVVLEGGYNLKSLTQSVCQTVQTLLGDPAPRLSEHSAPCVRH
ncbi:von Willebrand factor A domain-containing protein 5A-like isoform X2 [Xyrauchen texanus]|uniref:von Willebrand factor A domain-containing protein 5A-like isoform X2 n=1 Tax=Xyrauchen texanus TaxID=154827 RepID=UPI00224281FC|nr:von Willebrand factor A domain-containing protein 5A-like isoform X2 [Xyrauchen texanus]